MRRWIAVGSLVAFAIGIVPAWAATVEVVLDDSGLNEVHPARSEGYLVYSELAEGANSFVMPDGGDPLMLNRDGTDSRQSTIDGTTVAFAETVGVRDSQIRLYDVVSETRLAVPAVVKSESWDDDPALSGDWLLLRRTNSNLTGPRFARERVLLVNLDTEERRQLLIVPSRRSYVATGQVTGDWATFESCRTPVRGYTDCQVWLYRISTDTLTELPNPGLQQYAGGVTSDGTVYLVRSASGDVWECGLRARIVRMPLGGPGEVIHRFAENIDAITSFAFEETDDSVSLYLGRWNCGSGRLGIVRIPDADTAVP